jgi:HK97 family phage major capsid protein
MFVTLKKDHLGHKAGATLDIHEEPIARSLIEQGVAEAVQGDPYGPLMAKAMQASVETLTRQLNTVLEETLKQFKDAQEQSRRVQKAVLFGGADGDPERNFGDWLLNVARAGSRNVKAASAAQDKLEKVYKSAFNTWSAETKAAMGEASGATGGYIVPPDFYQQLL